MQIDKTVIIPSIPSLFAVFMVIFVFNIVAPIHVKAHNAGHYNDQIAKISAAINQDQLEMTPKQEAKFWKIPYPSRKPRIPAKAKI